MPGAATRVGDRLLEGLDSLHDAPPGFGAPEMTPGPGAATASPEQGAALEVLRRANERAQESLDAKAAATVADVGKGTARGGSAVAKMSTKDIQAQIEHIRALAANPMRLAADTHAHLQDAAEHAPQVATNAAATMGRSVGELHAAAPDLPAPSLGNPEPEISRTKALEFAKLKHAVEHPDKADWSDPAVWRIIKAVYPAYAARAASMILQALPKHPTQHQIQLAAQVTGLPLTQGSDPSMQALFQQLMQTAPMKNSGHGHTGSGTGLPKARLSKPGVGKMHFAEATETSVRQASKPV